LSGRAWNMLYLENHDHPRIISRYGSEKFWKESGKTLAASYLFQQGTPFLYQGQEIGMLNWQPENADMYEDVQTRYNYAHSNLKKSPEERLHKMWRSSRDSARTPVQWDDSENAGFSTGTPWFYVNPNYKKINVAEQEQDPDSILNFYRKAIHLRKELPVVRFGNYKEYFRLNGKQYVFTREMSGQKLLVICSFSEQPTPIKIPKNTNITEYELILTNYTEHSDTLQPYECRVYLLNK
ncbi:MAG: glucohydrolase, partial [Clostridia bacterium]|nr:glucohydrolase [Clostridia bacterium]